MEIRARHEYREELASLEHRALDGLDLVVASLDRTVEAVEHQDIELAELVIADDDVIDGRYLEVHQAILTLLATQAPVATDLRLIAALLHVMKNIERMGDQCVNIAKLTKLTLGLVIASELLESFRKMGDQAEAMTTEAMAAFAERNIERAERLVIMDSVINSENRELSRRIMALGGDERMREAGLRAILISRCMERIGDNAVDIGERVAYLASGEFREFTDASHPGE
jgi:phosphate transport system protein